MGWLAALVCGGGAASTVLLVLGGLLRLSVSLANRGLAPGRPETAVVPPRSGGIPEWDWDDWDDEPADERAEPQKPWRARPAIPEPGTVKSMAIMLLVALAYAACWVLLDIATWEFGDRRGRVPPGVPAVLSLPVGLFVLTALLAIALPTRFGRAALVAFIYGLVLVAVAGFIGCVVVGLGVFLR